jgi:uncharacterized protein YajQ (UPF0234 family)
MPSFDTLLEPDMVEVRNAVEQTTKEVGTRFDFKGTGARIELAEKEITLHGDSDFQLKQITDVLLAKMTKRGVDVRFLDMTAKPEKVGGDKLKQLITVKAGIGSELARRIQKLVKESKLKVQSSIQGDTVRMQGSKRDDLQAAIAMLRKEVDDVPLKFSNFRE